MLVVIMLSLLIIFLLLIKGKVTYLESRSGATKIRAELYEYRKEKGPMRNDYTLLDYPYVKIQLDDGDYVIKKLKYANSLGKNFEIGEKIDVFWYGNDLLYWNAYDNGIYRYIPSSWKFL